MLRINGAVTIVFLLFFIITINSAQARMYRWVDESGQVHYSDRIPPEYADKERNVYDEEGRLISTVHSTKKKEQPTAEKTKVDGEAQRYKKAEQQDKVDKAPLGSNTNTQELNKTTEAPLAAVE